MNLFPVARQLSNLLITGNRVTVGKPHVRKIRAEAHYKNYPAPVKKMFVVGVHASTDSEFQCVVCRA